MKNQIDWQKLGFAVAEIEKWQEYIESQKPILRELADDELANDYVLVNRKNSPIITYSNEYKQAKAKFEAKLKEKFPPTKIDRLNYSIELAALQTSTKKAEATAKCAKLTAKTINRRITASKR
jgi:hypothetical protein